MRPSDFYSRYANPTVRAFEDAIAELEGAEDALAFGSGMGAIASTVLALCSAGDHIVIQRQIYAGTIAFVQGPCARLGIEHTVVDGTQPGAFAAAVRPGRTMLVIAESPSNPRLDLVDLDDLGAVSGPFTVVDSTFATPIGQQPLRHGIDLVLHSATKGICGHNDATLGVIAGEADLLDAIWAYGVLHGASRLAVRRPQRAARDPHARRAPAPPGRPWRCRPLRRWLGIRASPPCTTPACPTTRSTTLAARQLTCLPTVLADRPRRRHRRRPHDARRAPPRPPGDVARRAGDARVPLRPPAPTSACRPRSRRRSASRPASCASRSASRTATTSSPTSSGPSRPDTLSISGGSPRRPAGRRGRSGGRRCGP